MRSIYLSVDTPRWTPRTESDLQSALDQGLLSESHYTDFKRGLTTGKSANRELARDLASFGIDGGTLVVGVEENRDGSFGLYPGPLHGLAERVEQVALTIPDPPLPVYTEMIPSDADPDVGYLFVHVPPSPAAPHMVDHRYLGRGDKTKHHLADAEVRRLHNLRRLSETDTLALLDAEFDRDPVPVERRSQSHLFLLAEPINGRPEMLLSLVSGREWPQRMLLFTRGAILNQPTSNLRFAPELLSATATARRAAGAALTSYDLTADRRLRDDSHDEDAVELEIHEDGGIRIFMSRLSDRMTNPDEQVVFDAGAVMYARHLIALVLAAADQAGYVGNWALAVGATNLRGRRSYEYRNGWDATDGPRFGEDTYRKAAVVSHAQLLATPGQVAGQLLARLLRALGTDDKFAPFLTDATESATST
ncbi:AlbA family DNA-binding domain-containing protein [Micromonospora sp. RB23]